MKYLFLFVLLGILSGEVLAQNVSTYTILKQQIQNNQSQLANCSPQILNQLTSQINYWQAELNAIRNIDANQQNVAVNSVV